MQPVASDRLAGDKANLHKVCTRVAPRKLWRALGQRDTNGNRIPGHLASPGLITTVEVPNGPGTGRPIASV